MTMLTFKKSAALILLALVASAVLPASSQSSELTLGIVRKIDIENSKVTIRHEEIQHLDMPPMTMVFSVKNKTLLDKIQPGQTIKFGVINEGGKFVITELQPSGQ